MHESSPPSEPVSLIVPGHPAAEPLHDPLTRSWQWKSLGGIARIASTLLFDLKVYGLQHIPASGGAILATNHQSNLDPVLFGVRLRRPVSYMAKDSLFRNGFLRWLITSLHAFPVKRAAADVGAMKEAIRRVQQGHLLNIYPEGTRSEDGRLGPILSGIALVVKRAGAPIIPAVVDGAFDAWGPQRRLPRPFPILVEYGPPLRYEGLKATEVPALIQRTFQSMLAELARKRLELERIDPWQKRKDHDRNPRDLSRS